MLSRRTPLRPSGRDTGPNGATRVAVVMRDESRCVRCGAPVWREHGGDLYGDYSIHHRLPRGRGGRNQLANLLLLCGSATTGCHSWVESHRKDAYAAGYLVRTTDDPADVPVQCARRGLSYLSNDGQWRAAV